MATNSLQKQQKVYTPLEVSQSNEGKNCERQSVKNGNVIDKQTSKLYVNMPPVQEKKDKKAVSAISLAEEFLSASESEEPKVMDLRIVIEMFKEIKNDIQVNSDKMDSVTNTQQKNDEQVVDLKKEISFYKSRSELMSGVIQKMSRSMSKMESRLSRLERNITPPGVVVSGLKISDKTSDGKAQLEDFFTETIGVEVDVIDHYKMGEEEPKPVVVTVADVEKKKEILQNKLKLKDITGSMGQSFYINEHLPADINEKKVRERQIFQANKRNTASQVQMSFFRGGLKIQNQQYKSKVEAPDPANFLLLTPEELDEIMAVKLHQGKQVSDNDGRNILAAFTTPAATHNEVNKAYAKMKLKFPQATHIVCTYVIPGQEVHYCQDFCDDGDYGVGRRVLAMMKRNNITSRAIFIVRYTDGTKLGTKRFPSYMEAATNAVNTSPENYLTKTSQRIQKKMNSPRKPYDSVPIRGTGRRGSTRGGRDNRIYQPLSTNRIRRNEWFAKQSIDQDSEPYSFQNPWDARDKEDDKENEEWKESNNVNPEQLLGDWDADSNITQQEQD